MAEKTKKTTTKKVSAEEKAEKSNKTKKKESKTGLWLAGFLGTLAVVVGVTVAVVCLNKGDSKDPKARLSYSDAFFIYSNSKYTLWNAEGKRLTEDEYSYGSSFVAGYAMVRKDGQVGIIDSNGRMVIDYGKYGEITTEGGLYLATDGNTKEEFLITGNGRVLAKGESLDVTANNSTGGFAMVEAEKNVSVYNYEGKMIKSIEADEEADDAKIYSREDYGNFCYKNSNTVFDARDGRIVSEFEGPCYSFDSVSDDRAVILMESDGDEEDDKYKLITNGKTYDLNETKYYGITALGDVVGYDDYSALSLLDENYRVVKKVSTYLALKDYKNYAAANDDGNVDIIYKGEVVKTFTDEADLPSGVMYEDYYGIKDGGKSKFYRLDGSVAFDHEYQEIRTLFNEHHHAVVADEENEYYLIDANGKRIGDWVAKQVSVKDGGYDLRNADNKHAIADKNGQQITEFKYTNVGYKMNAVGRNIWSGQVGDSSYDVIDADSNTVLVENVNAQSFYTNYFTVKIADGKTEYYTYKGELFFTSEV